MRLSRTFQLVIESNQIKSLRKRLYRTRKALDIPAESMTVCMWGRPYDNVIEAAPSVVTPLHRRCQPRTEQPVHKVCPWLSPQHLARSNSDKRLSPEIWVTSLPLRGFQDSIVNRRRLRSECEVAVPLPLAHVRLLRGMGKSCLRTSQHPFVALAYTIRS